MKISRLGELDVFTPEKLREAHGRELVSGKTSALLLIKDHISTEEFSELAQKTAAFISENADPHRVSVLDEVPSFDQNTLNHLKEMYKANSR